MKARPLWRCPKCGKYYVTRNLWHACARHTLAEHFARRDPKLRLLFDGIVGLLKRCGPLRVVPGKAGIAFQVRMRFGGVRVGRDRLRVAFVLPRRLDNPRVTGMTAYSPRTFGHHVEIRSPADLDAELAGWLREAYRVGAQADLLAGQKSPRPKPGDFSWSAPLPAATRVRATSEGLPSSAARRGPSRPRALPAWKCPRCGRRFATRNQMHLCSPFTLREFLAQKSPHAVALYRKLAAQLTRLGGVQVAAQRTRVAFHARKVFLGVRFLRDALDLELSLPRRIEHPRFRQILSMSPRSHYHTLRISSPAELDRDALAWIREAYLAAR
jgi:transposase-like protein